MLRYVRQLGPLFLVAAGVLALHACDRQSDTDPGDAETNRSESLVDIPEDQSRSGWTDREQYFVEVIPRPNPIPFQKLFELEVRIWRSDRKQEPVEKTEIDDVRARMPAHDHGMKTAPETESEGPGEFTVRGMRFHMQGLGEDGRWVFDIVVDGPDGIDRATFDVQCCRPGTK